MLSIISEFFCRDPAGLPAHNGPAKKFYFILYITLFITVRVKGGMSLQNGIIMRNTIYAE